jgi:hypothetical protein
LAESLSNCKQKSKAEAHIVHKKLDPYLPKDNGVLDRPLIQQKEKHSNLKVSKISNSKNNEEIDVYSGPENPCPVPKTSVVIIEEDFELSLNVMIEHIFGYESANSKFCRNFWLNTMKYKGYKF